MIVRELLGRNLVRASCGWWTSDGDLRRSQMASPRPQEAEAELSCDGLHRLDDRADVVVEVDAELLRALVDLVPVDTGREGGLLELLLDRLRLEPLEAGRAHERARVDEAAQLVTGEERLLQRRVARQPEVLGVREDRLDDLPG